MKSRIDDFSVGDIVYLVTGSPSLAVQDVCFDTQTVHLMWFSDGDLKERWVAPEILTEERKSDYLLTYGNKE